MFTNLKTELYKEEVQELIASRIYESSIENVKDKFLDDPEFVALDDEDDPEIEELIEKIPEYGPNPEKELKKIEESFIEQL